MLSRDATPTRSQAHESGTFGIAQRELDQAASVISVEGELDLSTAPRLKWMLLDSLAAGQSQLVLDLSLTRFMDSTALALFVAQHKRLEASGSRLIITSPGFMAMRLFQITGLTQVLTIEPPK